MFLALAATVVVTALPTQPMGTHTQIYPTDCAVAALQDTLQAYGIDESQNTLAEEVGWKQGSGTNLEDARAVLQDYTGLTDEFYDPSTIPAEDLRELAGDDAPVMIMVNANLLPWYSYAKNYTTPTWHEIVLDGRVGRKLRVFDVADGWHLITAKRLAEETYDAIWHV